MMVIMMAKMNPSFGATGGRLRPEFFVSKLGVFTIFFINGIALSIGACCAVDVIMLLLMINVNVDRIVCRQRVLLTLSCSPLFSLILTPYFL
jgi:hypothetical protein